MKPTQEWVKHEQGLAYVLLNPPAEPIHALDLATRIAAIHGKKIGITEIEDPNSGEKVLLENHSCRQERSFALDDAQTMRADRGSASRGGAAVKSPSPRGPFVGYFCSAWFQ